MTPRYGVLDGYLTYLTYRPTQQKIPCPSVTANTLLASASPRLTVLPHLENPRKVPVTLRTALTVLSAKSHETLSLPFRLSICANQPSPTPTHLSLTPRPRRLPRLASNPLHSNPTTNGHDPSRAPISSLSAQLRLPNYLESPGSQIPCVAADEVRPTTPNLSNSPGASLASFPSRDTTLSTATALASAHTSNYHRRSFRCPSQSTRSFFFGKMMLDEKYVCDLVGLLVALQALPIRPPGLGTRNR